MSQQRVKSPVTGVKQVENLHPHLRLAEMFQSLPEISRGDLLALTKISGKNKDFFQGPEYGRVNPLPL